MSEELLRLQARCAEQQAELKKLKTINQALMARVEAGSSVGTLAPYAAFQQTALLAEQVRERTAELNAAYQDLKRSLADSESLRQSERWIRTITDNVPAMLAYLSAEGRYLFTNRQYDDFYGVARGSLQNADLTAAHGEQGRDKLQPYVYRVLNGETVQFEIAEPNAQQQWRDLLKSYVPHRDQQGDIVGFFVLCRDITERKQTSEALRAANLHLEQRVQQRTAALTELNNELAQAKVAAEQANASKSQFLAAVSHDVLQPLNAARLFNGALLDLALPGPARHLAESVASALDDMTALLRTLVDLSRLEAGQLECSVGQVALGPLLSRLYQEYLPQAQARGLLLRYRDCPYYVTTDPGLLLRVMRNLISNALRYTPAGGRILLGWRKRSAAKGETVVEVQVIDTGIGIAKTEHATAFKAFSRLAPAQHPQEKGLGLGLAIVEKICQLLAHPLRLASTPGKGSLFALSMFSTAHANDSNVAATRSAVSFNPTNNAVIWVLDNEPALCLAMRALLSGWGYQVCTADSAVSLMQLALTGPAPDVLIVDYHLAKGENGVSTAIALKQQLARPDLPVLLLTADHSSALAQQVKTQVTQLLYKPVKPLKLRLALQFLLGS